MTSTVSTTFVHLYLASLLFIATNLELIFLYGYVVWLNTGHSYYIVLYNINSRSARALDNIEPDHWNAPALQQNINHLVIIGFSTYVFLNKSIKRAIITRNTNIRTFDSYFPFANSWARLCSCFFFYRKLLLSSAPLIEYSTAQMNRKEFFFFSYHILSMQHLLFFNLHV